MGDRTLDGFCYLNGTDGDILTINSGGIKNAYLVKGDLSAVLATTLVTTSETSINEVISDGNSVYLLGYSGSGATQYVKFYQHSRFDFSGSAPASSSISPG